MERDELAAWLRLSLTPGVGNLNGRKLLATFGLPQTIFDQPTSALRQIVSPAMAIALHSLPADFEAQLQATLDWLQEAVASGANNRFLLTLGDPSYPAALLNTEDPPLMLYLQGHIDLIAQASVKTGVHASALKPIRDCIAIVGSRNPTPQGLLDAHAFAKTFSEAGLVVVSGLALGIDGAAHEGALEGHLSNNARSACGGTIAVIGTGLDRVYPKKHLDLAHRIVQHGLMVSEFPLGTPPLPPNFPKRNRIISALSLGTLVVEAAVKSGSLITARMANEQGKEVFAIPGSIHSTQSRGCHALIKQGAKLVESAQDVLEELRLQLTPPPLPNSKLLKQTHLSDTDTDTETEGEGEALDRADPDFEPDDLVKSLGYDPVSIDALVARTGWDAASLQVRLMELELDGQVARLQGGLYQRVVAG